MRKTTETHSRFFSKVLMIGSASALGPLFLLLAFPLLTRLYTPMEYGLFGLFEAILAILVSFCTLGYQLPIPVPESDREASELLATGLIVCLLISLLLGLLSALLDVSFLSLFEAQAIQAYLWLIPLTVFGSGIYQCFDAWAIRQGRLGDIARARLSQGAGQVVSQVALGLNNYGAPGLMLGLAGARLLGAVAIVTPFGLKPIRALRRTGMASIIVTAWRYRRFPLLSSWSHLLIAVSLQFSVLLMGFYYTPEVVGWYNLALLVVAGPVLLINAALVQTFLAERTGSPHTGSAPTESRVVYRQLCRISVVPAVLLVFCVPSLFSFLFGGSWFPAGQYAGALILAFIGNFIGGHLPAVVVLRSLQQQELVFNIVLFTLRVAGISAGAIVDSALLSVWLFGTASFVATLAYDAWLLSIDGSPVRESVRILLRELAIAGLVCAPVLLGSFWFGIDHVWPLTCSVLLASIYWITVAQEVLHSE